MDKSAIFDKKNVLVTGGAGFIGSHLCDELLKTSKVICVDNFITGDEKNIDHLLSEPNFEFVNHDISLPMQLEDLPELEKFRIKFQGIQEVYHLACPTSPLDFQNNIIKTLDTVSLGTKNTLEIALNYKAKFMLFSSSVVYGPRSDDKVRIDESNIGQVDFLSSRSSYDEGKRFSETMTINYRRFYNMDAKIIRLFRTYGPRMELDKGNMIPDFVSNALDNKDLVIFGDENFMTSLCYVGDAIDAAIKLMDGDLSGPYNIGSDVDARLSDVAQKIIEMTGSKSKIKFADKIEFMTPLCLPSIKKIREDLGWMPVVTLNKGLEKTIDDLRASKGLVDINERIRKGAF